ncbi:hypothetical protein JOB18_028321 [Solea senegalensis]|uniref:Uncharacterized protein n=1 Tax=Solea senegalensis TaxID=28829 RepID=A0AAV6RXC5_SOLSE|nr:hypothetical protein JOB18_028321 [Solea senegalensis]
MQEEYRHRLRGPETSPLHVNVRHSIQIAASFPSVVDISISLKHHHRPLRQQREEGESSAHSTAS